MNRSGPCQRARPGPSVSEYRKKRAITTICSEIQNETDLFFSGAH